jgi:hypothetical protein
MNFTTLPHDISVAWSRAEAFSVASPELAGIGLVIGAGALAAVIIMVLTALVRALASARRAALASAVRRTNDVGARILILSGMPGRQKAISVFLRKTCEAHLKDFMFGGPFRVIHYPGTLEGDEQAIKLLKHTECDLVIWAETPHGARGVARILSRPSNPFETQRPPITLAMPKERSAWSEPMARAMAYAAAKQFRPALGRPQDFRAERLKPVVETLLTILAAKPKVDPKLLAEMVDDAASGSLQLAFAGDDTWIDKSVEIATSTLAEINRSVAPDRWITAKVTLGRALRLRAEKRFDPVLLREGIAHLTEALDALRSEPRFKLAESAAQAIGDAQKLLGTRRKFSISGGSI